MRSDRHRWSNKLAAGNVGIASRLTIGQHWPGVGDPGRRALHTGQTRSTTVQ